MGLRVQGLALGLLVGHELLLGGLLLLELGLLGRQLALERLDVVDGVGVLLAHLVRVHDVARKRVERVGAKQDAQQVGVAILVVRGNALAQDGLLLLQLRLRLLDVGVKGVDLGVRLVELYLRLVQVLGGLLRLCI